MRVVWTETAVKHLSAIYEYIAQSSPLYAEIMVRRLSDRAGQLRAFPQSGRAVPETNHPDVRELLERPYRIIYHASPDVVEVLAVVHARRGPDAVEEAGAGRAV